ncbi:MAG UNVERIFIED_CONTAM: hypothetical protein LVR18_18235 [Planctomycetaceae bacterium]
MTLRRDGNAGRPTTAFFELLRLKLLASCFCTRWHNGSLLSSGLQSPLDHWWFYSRWTAAGRGTRFA